MGHILLDRKTTTTEEVRQLMEQVLGCTLTLVEYALLVELDILGTGLNRRKKWKSGMLSVHNTPKSLIYYYDMLHNWAQTLQGRTVPHNLIYSSILRKLVKSRLKKLIHHRNETRYPALLSQDTPHLHVRDAKRLAQAVLGGELRSYVSDLRSVQNNTPPFDPKELMILKSKTPSGRLLNALFELILEINSILGPIDAIYNNNGSTLRVIAQSALTTSAWCFTAPLVDAVRACGVAHEFYCSNTSGKTLNFLKMIILILNFIMNSHNTAYFVNTVKGKDDIETYDSTFLTLTMYQGLIGLLLLLLSSVANNISSKHSRDSLSSLKPALVRLNSLPSNLHDFAPEMEHLENAIKLKKAVPIKYVGNVLVGLVSTAVSALLCCNFLSDNEFLGDGMTAFLSVIMFLGIAYNYCGHHVVQLIENCTEIDVEDDLTNSQVNYQPHAWKMFDETSQLLTVPNQDLLHVFTAYGELTDLLPSDNGYLQYPILLPNPLPPLPLTKTVFKRITKTTPVLLS